ncbi:MAG TPA: NADH-quinone oxidoreductase subunit C [Actinomycetota bacterium]|nr:NADH-quinone oxidoreductase subunit C [Actinomycetota bacterium]
MDTTTRTFDDVERALREALPQDAISEAESAHWQLRVRYAAEHRVDILAVLKGMGFTFYSFCSAIDWPGDNRFEVFDHVYSMEDDLKVTVRCDIPRDNPRVASAVPVYGGADWHEREAWEMFGIVFHGHPRLARLLLPDWFEGYPLRRDFELAPRVEKPWPGASFEG